MRPGSKEPSQQTIGTNSEHPCENIKSRVLCEYPQVSGSSQLSFLLNPKYNIFQIHSHTYFYSSCQYVLAKSRKIFGRYAFSPWKRTFSCQCGLCCNLTLGFGRGSSGGARSQEEAAAMEKGTWFGQEHSGDLKGQDAHPPRYAHPRSQGSSLSLSGLCFDMVAYQGHAFSPFFCSSSTL